MCIRDSLMRVALFFHGYDNLVSGRKTVVLQQVFKLRVLDLLHRQPDKLAVEGLELIGHAAESHELGSADRREVGRVAEKNGRI